MIRPIDIIPAKARLFRSVGDEGRLTILEALGGGERRVTDLAEETRQSQSAVSTHLAALHAAGLVVRRAAGREAWYALAYPTVGTLLDVAEEIVMAASGENYACVSPCCSPTAESDA
jgi:DNA-binding transcriptional ArsR family regulator